ncbi:hypothetical protein Ctob_003537, partial [Chrysochromulina tobinii]
MADEGLLVSLVCARHERQAAADQAERLALENLMLARRAAELERRLEDLRAANASSGLSGLLGWSAPPPSHDDLDAELQARADENLQLQHAIFEQQREHERQRKLHMHLCDADMALLRRALGEAEEEAENARAGIAAAIAERVRERTEQRANVDALHAVCYELQLKCKTTLDELDENTKLIERLRERDLEHQVAALRAALLEADASRTAAERRADIATEELALSSERFQQQIGMLSDALAEQNAKEE